MNIDADSKAKGRMTVQGDYRHVAISGPWGLKTYRRNGDEIRKT